MMIGLLLAAPLALYFWIRGYWYVPALAILPSVFLFGLLLNALPNVPKMHQVEALAARCAVARRALPTGADNPAEEPPAPSASPPATRNGHPFDPFALAGFGPAAPGAASPKIAAMLLASGQDPICPGTEGQAYEDMRERAERHAPDAAQMTVESLGGLAALIATNVLLWAPWAIKRLRRRRIPHALRRPEDSAGDRPLTE